MGSVCGKYAPFSRGGGTGRRTRLKIWRGQLHIGSIPILGMQKKLRFFT